MQNIIIEIKGQELRIIAPVVVVSETRGYFRVLVNAGIGWTNSKIKICFADSDDMHHEYEVVDGIMIGDIGELSPGWCNVHAYAEANNYRVTTNSARFFIEPAKPINEPR